MTTYVHGGGKIGVMVTFDSDVADKEGFAAYAKDVARENFVTQLFLDRQIRTNRFHRQKLFHRSRFICRNCFCTGSDKLHELFVLRDKISLRVDLDHAIRDIWIPLLFRLT